MHSILITITDACALLQLLDDQKALEALEVPRSYIPESRSLDPDISASVTGSSFATAAVGATSKWFCWTSFVSFLNTCQDNGQFLPMSPHMSLTHHMWTSTQRATRGLQLNTSCADLLSRAFKNVPRASSQLYELPAFANKPMNVSNQWSTDAMISIVFKLPTSKWISIWLDVTNKAKAFTVTIPNSPSLSRSQ